MAKNAYYIYRLMHEQCQVKNQKKRDKDSLTKAVKAIKDQSLPLRAASAMYDIPEVQFTINSTYGVDASVLVQMSTESAQTTCMHFYNFKLLQTSCTCRQSIRKT